MKPAYTKHHKCRECREYPESLPSSYYCQYVDRQTSPGSTACYAGKAKKKEDRQNG